MKKFVLSIFIFSFISTASYGYHHEERHGGYDADSFHDDYNEGYGQEKSHNRPDVRRVEKRSVFKLKKGEVGKKRRYSKHQMHKQKMRHLKRRLSKLPAAKRDAALNEIKRHRHEMGRIIGGDKRFPEFPFVKNGATPPKKMPRRQEVRVTPQHKAAASPRKAKKHQANPTADSSGKVKFKGRTKKQPSNDQLEQNSEPKTESNNTKRGSGKWRYPKKVV